MKRLHALFFFLAVFLALASQLPTQAAILYSGDLDPANPNDWTDSTDAYIGYTNTSDPGQVEVNGGSNLLSQYAYLGYAFVTSGTVTITGTGSIWTNRYQLYVGHSGNGTLSITNGGTVSNSSGYIGSFSGSTGVVTVDGAKSTWDNNNTLYVGHSGNGTLNITGGGSVNNSYGSIGNVSGSTGAVTVNGVGSTWNNKDTLYIGNSGSGTLMTTNGGVVSNSYGYIGYYSGSAGIVTINGVGSTWNNRGSFYVGNYGSGTLNITGGGVVNNGNSHIGSFSGSTGIVTVDGVGSAWTNSGYLSIGHWSSGTLSITGGGTVSNYNGYIGSFSGSAGVVTVDGAGSTWNNSFLRVGQDGSGTLKITNGGIVNNSSDGHIGDGFGSTGIVTVDGAGSAWNNNDEIYIGKSGSGTLSITNGGAVSSNVGYIGHGSVGNHFGSTGIVTVGGTGSTWNNTNDLYVSRYSSGILSITNGGTVNNSNNSYIGGESGSAGVVTVNGSGSTWTNDRFLCIGQRGNGTLNITNGGTVSNGDTSYIGRYSGSTGVVTVNGAGSTWTNDDEVHIGNGTLNITNGGTVSNSGGSIGSNSGSTGVVTVNGTGSIWNNSGELYIGDKGNGTLNITNGGAVNVTNSTYVAYDNGSTGSIHFDASGSTLTTRSLVALPTQLFGTGVINTNGIVSDYDLVFDSTHGLVQTLTIGGSGQDRNITVNLDMSSSVGVLGVNNGSMNINGITVNSQFGYVGYYPGSTGVATVDGTGSTWNNSDDLYVGYSGSGTLSITDGGIVSNSRCYIGRNSGSTGIVTVNGAGSTWTNSSLRVGWSGSGTLTITNGGLVSVARTLYIDYYNNDDSFLNMSDGGMLALWGDADDSLGAFFDLILGTYAIQWWDPEVSGWNSLSSAIMGEDYTLEYLTTGDLAGYTLLTVTAIEPVPGDINCDGMVDSSDFAMMANNWQVGVSDGQTANWAMGDFNGDHKVDSSDFAVMCNNWQAGVGLSLSNVAVPEPGCVVLLLALVAVGMVVRVKRSRR